MTIAEQCITVAIVVIGTQLTRWLPFVLFRSSVKTPEYIYYLGRVLPPAIFGMLVVYCYKDVDFLVPDYGLKEVVSGCLVALMQLLSKNMCLSIVIGTSIYIIWVNGWI